MLSIFTIMPHSWHIFLLVYVYFPFVFHTDALPYENEYGPDYGKEWIVFLDDDGETHTLNFSYLPADERGLLLGDAYFYLYTRRNKVAEMIEIPEDDSHIDSQYFNSSNELKMITHGWLGQENSTWIQKMKNSLLEKSDYNVICVDWSELAQNPIYPWPAFGTRYVGKKIAKLLMALRRSHQVDGRRVHLIGHSLGAQVMGYAGMFYDQRIQRVTGLDPARPLFELPRMGKNFRLEKTDAEFVDIIHTCGGIYGYYRSHGHADFYPNDGKARQPGCEGAQSMIGFVAYPCESWDKYDKGECKENSTLMGYPASSAREGDFYLYTSDAPEYATYD